MNGPKVVYEYSLKLISDSLSNIKVLPHYMGSEEMHCWVLLLQLAILYTQLGILELAISHESNETSHRPSTGVRSKKKLREAGEKRGYER